MSSFIVEDKLIEKIVQSLEIAQNEGKNHSCPFPSLEYLDDGLILQNSILAGEKRLAEDMLHLNYRAVNYRYNGKSKAHKVNYNPDYFDRPNPVQVFKHLQCYLYQCSESDDIIKSPLFQALEKFKNALAVSIVEKTEEYKKSNWS